MKTILKILFTLFFIFIAGEVHAWRCTSTTTGVNFGNYDIFQTIQTKSTGSITVTCTQTTNNVTVSMSQSSNSGVFDPREMKKLGGTDLLNYNLFIDSSMLNVWGDGTSNTSMFRGRVQKNFPMILTVYGGIPAGQDVSPGLYTDILTVTVLP